MSRARVLAASPAAPRLTPDLVYAAWRGITRRQLGATFLLGCALLAYHVVLDMTPRDGAGLVLHFALEQLKAFAMLLPFVVADRVTGRDPDRRGVYALAVVAGAALGGAVIGSAGPTMSALWLGFDVAPSLGFAFYIGLEQVMLGGAAVWVINDRRRAQRARERMHDAEIERIAAEKRSIESDLQAMQARVEPQFLFNTLAQVRELYREDTARGESMLDELIAYLRAAMPRMRDTSSTLGQEIDLVRAYLSIARLRLSDRPAFEIESPTQIAGTRMPPMMLLPLVEHAIARGLAAPRTGGGLRIRTEVVGSMVRLEIADSGVGLVPDPDGEGIAGIRERLTALYGSAASLTLRERADEASEAVLQFPLESAEPVGPGA